MSAKSIRERLKAVSHGGTGLPYKDGCHCDKCKIAHSDRMKKLQLKRHQLMMQGLLHPKHGTKSTYNNYLCRCDLCSEANSITCKKYKANRKAAAQRVRELLSI